MMRDRNHLFWSMWDERGWARRKAGTDGCWNHGSGDAHTFFAEAYSGRACDINWLDGFQDGVLPDGAANPALMGHDPDILTVCLKKLGRWRKIWFARDTELAETCREAHENVLRLRRNRWNICVNYNYVACAATGRLPGQGSNQINFATPPSTLLLADMTTDADGALSDTRGRETGYKMTDVTYLEYCILNEICANNEQLFKVQPDEPFFCEHSQERYDAFRDLMLSMDT